MTKLRLLDLFSGIGGFSLGLERSGAFETVAFCEIEPFCRKVLAKHWPEVPCYDDVRTLTSARLAADGIAVDAICGGFPCQDISTAGLGAGIDGERSGLWAEYARLIGELRPCVVVVENVAALLGRGLDRVLGNLAALGYDAEWHCIPASAIGAPHRRDRIWIMAYPRMQHEFNVSGIQCGGTKQHEFGECGALRSHANGEGLEGVHDNQEPSSRVQRGSGGLCEIMADASSIGQSGQGQSQQSVYSASRLDRQAIDAFASGVRQIWSTEPAVGRVANGVPNRVDRLHGLGNAVVPQIPELIGRAIAKHMGIAA